jgi:hypothetical protein
LSLLFCRRAGNCHSACLLARRRVRRGSDKRFSRSSLTWMDISSPRLDFLLEKNRNRSAGRFEILENGKWKMEK